MCTWRDMHPPTNPSPLMFTHRYNHISYSAFFSLITPAPLVQVPPQLWQWTNTSTRIGRSGTGQTAMWKGGKRGECVLGKWMSGQVRLKAADWASDRYLCFETRVWKVPLSAPGRSLSTCWLCRRRWYEQVVTGPRPTLLSLKFISNGIETQTTPRIYEPVQLDDGPALIFLSL